ncbi:MAG: hypothetical protein WC595_01210 [Candidatus Nanoarchaeia archaeon]
MSFLTKNLNTNLLILLLFVGFGIAGITLFYMTNFQDINDQYSQKVEALNKTFNELTYTRNVINKTKEQLELKTLREEDLSEQYGELKEDEQKTAVERDQLKSTKASLEKKLLDTERFLVAEKHITADLEKENKELKDSVRNRRDENDRLQAEITRLRAQGCT